MSQQIKISLDAMGGDHGISVVVPAAIRYLKREPNVSIVLVGRKELLETEVGSHDFNGRLTIHHASQEVGMNELPSKALRKKKDSSLRVCINLVKSGEVDACVSAGNTGALMATARFVLKMLPHVDRPAIISALPAMNGHTWVLDLGANVDCSAKNLFQFAIMGSALIDAVDDDINTPPRVGLLNVGQEEIKGNQQVKLAHDLIVKSNLNYIGFVEGNDIFTDNVDLVVCDGFVGNAALKASEGLAKMISSLLRQGFNRNFLTKLSAIAAMSVINSLRKTIDPRRYNGAIFLGLRGIVIKSHGGADIVSFGNAIDVAKKAVLTDVASRISEHVESQLRGSSSK